MGGACCLRPGSETLLQSLKLGWGENILCAIDSSSNKCRLKKILGDKNTLCHYDDKLYPQHIEKQKTPATS